MASESSYFDLDQYDRHDGRAVIEARYGRSLVQGLTEQEILSHVISSRLPAAAIRLSPDLIVIESDGDTAHSRETIQSYVGFGFVWGGRRYAFSSFHAETSVASAIDQEDGFCTRVHWVYAPV